MGIYSYVKKQPAGTTAMKDLADQIHEGAMAFLRREYSVLAVFLIIVALLLWWAIGGLTALAFITGALSSILAGFLGMTAATRANVRTSAAAQEEGQGKALRVAFYGGAVMGLAVAALGLVGVGIWYFFLGAGAISDFEFVEFSEIISGYAMGASSIALFARVGGGIYTKAADVGADLGGKVEAGIPEDDPRNPATIADNVGDNVGDVAGMGADLFGSYVATVLAAMVLGNYVIRDYVEANGTAFVDNFSGMGPVILPIVIAGVGIIASIIGTFLVRTNKSDASEADVQRVLNLGNWSAIIITAVVTFFLIRWMLPSTIYMDFFGEGILEVASINVFYASLIG